MAVGDAVVSFLVFPQEGLLEKMKAAAAVIVGFASWPFLLRFHPSEMGPKKRNSIAKREAKGFRPKPEREEQAPLS